MLRVEGISVQFGGVKAVNDLSFEIRPGALTGLIGPNGAGKTTTFNVVTGLQRPSSGRVHLGGEDITRRSPLRRSRMGLARTFQQLELFGSLTVRDNLLVALESRRGLCPRKTRHDVANSLLERVGLIQSANLAADLLSTGDARRLELARALATKPKVLLLDEASSGLDTHEKAGFAELLVDLVQDGMALLLVEHDMDMVLRICDQLFVLDFGSLLAAGTPAEIQASQAVQAAYLGSEPAHSHDGADAVNEGQRR